MFHTFLKIDFNSWIQAKCALKKPKCISVEIYSDYSFNNKMIHVRVSEISSQFQAQPFMQVKPFQIIIDIGHYRTVMPLAGGQDGL